MIVWKSSLMNELCQVALEEYFGKERGRYTVATPTTGIGRESDGGHGRTKSSSSALSVMDVDEHVWDADQEGEEGRSSSPLLVRSVSSTGVPSSESHMEEDGKTYVHKLKRSDAYRRWSSSSATAPSSNTHISSNAKINSYSSTRGVEATEPDPSSPIMTEEDREEMSITLVSEPSPRVSGKRDLSALSSPATSPSKSKFGSKPKGEGQGWRVLSTKGASWNLASTSMGEEGRKRRRVDRRGSESGFGDGLERYGFGAGASASASGSKEEEEEETDELDSDQLDEDDDDGDGDVVVAGALSTRSVGEETDVEPLPELRNVRWDLIDIVPSSSAGPSSSVKQGFSIVPAKVSERHEEEESEREVGRIGGVIDEEPLFLVDDDEEERPSTSTFVGSSSPTPLEIRPGAPGSRSRSRSKSSKGKEKVVAVVDLTADNEDDREEEEEEDVIVVKNARRRSDEDSSTHNQLRQSRSKGKIDEDQEVEVVENPPILKPPPLEVIRLNTSDKDVRIRFPLAEIKNTWTRLFASPHPPPPAHSPSTSSPNDIPISDSSASPKFLAKAAGITNVVSPESADKELSRVIRKDDFSRMEVLGQFNRGFIITRLMKGAGTDPERGERRARDDLFIIDQHASDEKYNFETLQLTTKIQSQKLLR